MSTVVSSLEGAHLIIEGAHPDHRATEPPAIGGNPSIGRCSCHHAAWILVSSSSCLRCIRAALQPAPHVPMLVPHCNSADTLRVTACSTQLAATAASACLLLVWARFLHAVCYSLQQHSHERIPRQAHDAIDAAFDAAHMLLHQRMLNHQACMQSAQSMS